MCEFDFMETKTFWLKQDWVVNQLIDSSPMKEVI